MMNLPIGENVPFWSITRGSLLARIGVYFPRAISFSWKGFRACSVWSVMGTRVFRKGMPAVIRQVHPMPVLQPYRCRYVRSQRLRPP